MEQQHSNDEIDLGLVFKKIGELWRSFLVWIFNCIQFVFRNWIVLLVLIVVGYGLGYVWKQYNKGQYEAVLLVKTNFGSANYVYDAIEKIRTNEKEPWFREKYGFNNEENVIKEIDIEPIVDILSLLNVTRDENRVLEHYLSEADFEEDILVSEAFINEYPLHRITIELTGDANNDAITGMLNYLNDNEYYNQAREVVIAETKAKIMGHEKSIEGVDAVFFSFKDSLKGNGPSQVNVKTNQTTNLHWLVEEKGRIMNTVETLKKDLLMMDSTVYVVNSPKINYAFKFFDQKQIITPVLFVFLFVFISWLISFYKKLSRIAKE